MEYTGDVYEITDSITKLLLNHNETSLVYEKSSVQEAGLYTITVSAPATTNYQAPVSKTIYVKVYYETEFTFKNGIGMSPENPVVLVYNEKEQLVDGYVTANSGVDLIYNPTKVQNVADYTITVTAPATEFYKDAETKLYIKVSPAVAKIGNKYYATIESALNAANGGDTVIVLPDSQISNGDVSLKTITANCEIKQGVTLNIPYELNKTSSGKGTGNNTTLEGTPTNTVIIASNITLTNNGTLIIGGILTGGNGGHEYAGHTYGQWSEIHLESGAKIESNGNIDCYGYIKDIDDNNSSLVHMKKGTLSIPFVLRDFYGGSVMSAIYKGISDFHSSAFNQFELRNITSKVRIEYGVQVKGWANLYAGSQINDTIIHLVGDIGSGALIELNNPNYSYLESKYDVDTEICNLNIYGGAKTNSMILKVSSATIDTSDVFFPISWRYKISLNRNNEKNQTTAEYTMDQRFKIMTGAELRIEEGVEAYINELIIYDSYNQSSKSGTMVNGSDAVITGSAASNMPILYPSGKAKGKLIVNGQLTVNKIGGEIYSETASSVLNVLTASSTTSYEPYVTSGKSILTKVDEYHKITLGLKLYYINSMDEFVNESEMFTLRDVASIGSYASFKRSNWTNVGWFSSTMKFTINYQYEYINGATPPVDIDIINSNATSVAFNDSFRLKQASQGDLIFVNWFNTDSSVIYKLNMLDYLKNPNFSGTITIVGQFKPNEKYVDINFNTGDYGSAIIIDPIRIAVSDLGNLDLSIFDDIFVYDQDDSKDKYFEGWYIDGDKVTSIPVESSGKEYTNGQVITLNANWKDKHEIVFHDANGEVVFIKYVHPDNLYYELPAGYDSSGNALAKADANKVTYTEKYEFNGWNTSKNNTDDNYYNVGYSFDMRGLDDSTKQTINLYANYSSSQWITISFSLSYGKIIINGYTKDSGDDSSIELPIGSTISITKVEFSGNNGNHQFKISTVNGGNNLSEAVIPSEENPYEVVLNENTTITVKSDNKSSTCLAEGTLITMADGTQKRVEDLQYGDQVLVFNHETGRLEVSTLIFNAHKEEPGTMRDVLNLSFSNGVNLRIVAHHGIFDSTLNEYVEISIDNVLEFIGHEFYYVSYVDGQFVSEKVILTGYNVTEEFIKVYSPITANQINCLAEGILTAPGLYNPLMNIFELDDNMKVDQEKKQADIEKYGLYEYEVFADYVSYEIYVAFGGQYYKVAVEKGLITFDEIIQIILDFNIKDSTGIK